jgi:uncharacterized protein YjiK
MKKYFLVCIVIALFGFAADKKVQLRPHEHHVIQLDEPSDICLNADGSSFYIVSNRGSIAEIDGNGKILRKTKYDGSDYESICIKDNQLYAIDESYRRVDVLDQADFKLRKSLYLTYMGPRNKGFEALTYIPAEKKFIAVTESPVMVYELNEQLQVINQLSPKWFSEISAVTYHNNYLWFLSDSKHEVLQVKIDDYKVVKQYNVPLNNPEGICFDANGNLIIVSDDMGQLFKFKLN